MKTQYRVLDSKVLAVAVEGAVKDWAAYVGAVEGLDFEVEYTQVAQKGTKLDKKIAEILFPAWKRLEWRN